MVSERLWQDAIEEIQILRRKVQELEDRLRAANTQVLDVEQPEPVLPTPPPYPGHHERPNCSGCTGC